MEKDEELEEMFKDVTEMLNEKFGDLGTFSFGGAINMNKMPKMLKGMLDSYMNEDIIVIKGARGGSDITITHCDYGDVKAVAAHMIGTLLNCIAEEDRNQVLYEAIQIPTSKKGSLFDEKEDGEK